MMSLTFGLFTQVSGSGPLGPLVNIYQFLWDKVAPNGSKVLTLRTDLILESRAQEKRRVLRIIQR